MRRTGQPVTAPVPLTEEGRKIDPNDDRHDNDEFYYIEYRLYKKAVFAELNLPILE